MYVTRPLSLYQKSPETLAERPPEGPSSGYLVLQDEESTGRILFGLFKDKSTTKLPFPQNKLLTVEHRNDDSSTYYPLFFIPVINLPLSANQYYVIKAKDTHIGEAYTSSTDEDRQMFCFCCSYIKDLKPRPLNPNDSHQQFKFSRTTVLGNSTFSVKSVAADGYPPNFLRQTRWSLLNSEPKNFKLGEAQGLNASLRASLPDFDFSLSRDQSKTQAVGKWYTPFMFIKEGTVKEQMNTSMFYVTTLEQKWERIYYCENNIGEGDTVSFNVVVPRQRVVVNGEETEELVKDSVGGTFWFRTRIGLSSLLMKRMIWEQERVGWSNEEKQVKVSRVEKYGGFSSWERFGCYMLVERFLFRRMDGSLAMVYEFNHTHQLKIKWDERL